MAFEIVAGTYEQFLLGYKFSEESTELKQTFAVKSHTSSVKCVHVLDRYIASGGTDDRIFVYDLLSRKEHCMLTQHDSTVTCVKFTQDRTHVISGSSDGTLAIVRVGNWQLEKIWEKTHKGAILNIAIHSSGKLALTLGTDRSLQTWNLVKGRQAYVINLSNKSKDPASLEYLVWGSDGERFVLAGGLYTEIWSIGKGGLLKAIQHSTKISSCIWYGNNTILTGYDTGKIGIVNVKSGEVKVKDCHSSRVKGIAINNNYIVTACSTGEIKVWDNEFNEIAKGNTGCRITCLDIALPYGVKEDVLKSESKNTNKRNVTRETDEGSENESDKEEIQNQPLKKKKRKFKKSKKVK